MVKVEEGKRLVEVAMTLKELEKRIKSYESSKHLSPDDGAYLELMKEYHKDKNNHFSYNDKKT